MEKYQNKIIEKTNYKHLTQKNITLQNAILQNACEVPAGAQGEAGANGEEGLSAYQVAVVNGFVGSEQDWLDSLQGAQGLQGITKSTIPYYAKNCVVAYNADDEGPIFRFANFGFTGEYKDVEFDIPGIPQTFVYDQGELDSLIAYTVPYNSVITSISGEIFGGGEMPSEYFYIHYVLYESAPLSNVFNKINQSNLQLQPMVNANSLTFRVNGTLDFSYNIVAGSKLALFAYMIPVDERVDSFMDMYGEFRASVVVESLN